MIRKALRQLSKTPWSIPWPAKLKKTQNLKLLVELSAPASLDISLDLTGKDSWGSEMLARSLSDHLSANAR
jgi:hypothetical protein